MSVTSFCSMSTAVNSTSGRTSVTSLKASFDYDTPDSFTLPSSTISIDDIPGGIGIEVDGEPWMAGHRRGFEISKGLGHRDRNAVYFGVGFGEHIVARDRLEVETQVPFVQVDQEAFLKSLTSSSIETSFSNLDASLKIDASIDGLARGDKQHERHSAPRIAISSLRVAVRGLNAKLCSHSQRSSSLQTTIKPSLPAFAANICSQSFLSFLFARFHILKIFTTYGGGRIAVRVDEAEHVPTTAHITQRMLRVAGDLRTGILVVDEDEGNALNIAVRPGQLTLQIARHLEERATIMVG